MTTPPASELQRRARVALRLLAGRQGVVQLLAMGGGIVVARILGPEALGVFGIGAFFVMLAGLIPDLGMRTAMIQQPDAVSDRRLASCFTLQHLLVTGVALLLFFGAPWIVALYGRPLPALEWVIRVLALDLYLRAWRSTGEIRLERELRYRELALADIAGTVGFQGVAVVGVLAGGGIESLVWATLAGNLVRVSTLYRAAPWPLRAAFDAAELRAVLRRSVPLQASWTVGQLPTWITPTLVAVWLGPEAVGLLTFAFMLGRKPLELIENLIRVALAQFARLQHDAAEVERVLLRYATASVLVTGLWLAIVAIAGHDLVGFLYSDRWLPAVPALGLYAVSAVIGSLRGLASAALIATGRFVQIARISVVSTLVSLAVSCGLLLELGLVGVPLGLIAGALVALPWLLRALATGAATRLAGAALVGARPLGVACAAGMLALWIPGVRAAGGLPLLGVVAAAYLATAWWGGPGWLRSVAREELALPWAAITRAR